VCGLHQHGSGVRGGATLDQTTGLEARFQAQVAHAALGITREEVNGYVLEFLSHYEGSLDNPNTGKSFPELYDEDTLEIKDEWLEPYYKVCDAISQLGLDVNNAWRKVLYSRGQPVYTH